MGIKKFKQKLYIVSAALLTVCSYQAGLNKSVKAEEIQGLFEPIPHDVRPALEEHLDEMKNKKKVEEQLAKDKEIEELTQEVIRLENELKQKQLDLDSYALKVSDMEKTAQAVYTDLPQTNFKAFMGYKKITNKSSTQWKLQQKKEAWSDPQGYRRLGDDYMIAVGQAFGKSGDRLRITMSTGKVFLATIGDSKRNSDTDPTNRQCIHNGSVLEFIVDEPVFRKNKAQFAEFEGSAVKIEKLGRSEYAFLD